MKYIIEGVKLSGKSTLADRIWKHCMGSTVINYRAYTKATPKPYTIHEDIIDRILSLAQFLNKYPNEPFIVTRAHLYLFALAKSTCQKIDSHFLDIDKLFKADDMLLILLTVNKKDYLGRLDQRAISSREEKDWDKDWRNIDRIQKNYVSLFKESCLRKIIFDSSLQKTDYMMERLIKD